MESRRLLIFWSIAVFVVVGAVLLVLALTQGEDTSYGDKPGGGARLVGVA